MAISLGVDSMPSLLLAARPVAAALPFLLFSAAQTAAAQRLSAFDPLLPTMTVTASRLPTRTDQSLAAVTVLTREVIETSGAATLVELLEGVPGARISQNGGPGSSSSLFLRGAEARHTLLLIDGMRIGSATTGQATLEAIPLELIERIEIVRGPASALYGSEAIGGVIQIFTRRGSDRLLPRAFVGFGNQQSKQATAGLSGRSGPLRYAFDVGGEATDGFDATTTKNSGHQPDRDGWRNGFLASQLSWQLAPATEIGLSLWATRGRNAYDSWGAAGYDSHLFKETTLGQIFAQSLLTDQWQATLRVGASRDGLENFASAKSFSRFATTQRQFVWQNDVALPVGVLIAAFETTASEVDSTTQYTKTSRVVHSSLLGWQAEAEPHGWQIDLRYDNNSQFGNKTTGSAAYRYQWSPQWQTRLATRTAFNAPTFNQLYWPDTGFGGGNPNLVPETAYQNEVGLRWQEGVSRAELTLYTGRVKNLIAGWPPANINRAEIKGAEAAVETRWDRWQVALAADWLAATDEATGNRLPRRAPLTLAARVRYDAGLWQAGLTINAQRERWDDLANRVRLAGFGRTDLWWHYRLAPLWRVEARVRNLFDQRYETAATYRQPDRSLFVGLRHTFQ